MKLVGSATEEGTETTEVGTTEAQTEQGFIVGGFIGSAMFSVCVCQDDRWELHGWETTVLL